MAGLLESWRYEEYLEEHADALKWSVDSLLRLRADVGQEVERTDWMKDALDAILQSNTYIQQYNSGKDGFGWMTTPSSYKLVKQMMRLNATIQKLCRECDKFIRYGVEVYTMPVADINEIQEEFAPSYPDTQAETSALSSSQFISINEVVTYCTISREDVMLHKLWEWIIDPNILRIGIWGKEGVGKTTMIRNIINSKLYRTTHFDVVIVVVVSSYMNMTILRQNIAKELGLDISEEENILAANLFKKLRGMRFFLFFDDIWTIIDLNSLGVPAPTKTNGCKVVITTRKKAVCQSMETDRIIFVPIQLVPRGNKEIHIPKQVPSVLKGDTIAKQDTTSHGTQAKTSLALSQEYSTKYRSSTENTLDEIWQCILDPHILRIGICGKGGVGKTMLIRNIINTKLYKTTHFNIVIIVVVSHDLNMRKLRLSIAKQLGLDLSGEEDERAAQHLYNVLVKRKFFLILDDVWDRIDLDALGAPAPTRMNGCKLLLTTRKKALCRHMKTDKAINVSDLPAHEAWELFCDKAGGVMSPSIESIARLVCMECHGLPLALIVVGRALRRQNDKREWENALQVFRSSDFQLKDMEYMAFSRLKLSYDHLKTDTLRNCFLYCALFPEGCGIYASTLIIYWATEGLIDINEGFAHALDKARHDILEELLESCLVEKNTGYNGYETIHMNNVTRHMAIKIMLQNGRPLLLNAAKALDEGMEANDWSQVDKISLMECNIKTLPDAPYYPKLSTLLLLHNNTLEHIPDSFFTSMITLRVLVLSFTSITILPQSINGLVNLQALILYGCSSLTTISRIEGLRSLLLLDLKRTPITELPDAIWELNFLRSLDLSYTHYIEKISAGAILKLTNLEFLEMKGCRYFEGSASKEAVIGDIGCLMHLHHLSLDLSSSHNALCLIFPKFQKLQSFDIRLGPPGSTNHNKRDDKDGFLERSRRCLELDGITNSSHIIFALARYADKLVLSDIDILDVVSSLPIGDLVDLKELWMSDCDLISKAIIDEKEEIIFPNLEVLCLSSMLKMPCIWEVKGVSGTFRSIKSIEMDGCTSAMYIFSIDVVSELVFLERLKITYCKSIKQIVRGESNQIKSIPKLEYLELCWLSSLKALWEPPVFMPTLREIRILYCGTLKHLDLSKDIAPSLGCIEGQHEWLNDLIWTSEATRSYCQPLFMQPEVIDE